MIRFPHTVSRIARPILVTLSAVIGFGLAALAFLNSLQNSLASG